MRQKAPAHNQPDTRTHAVKGARTHHTSSSNEMIVMLQTNTKHTQQSSVDPKPPTTAWDKLQAHPDKCVRALNDLLPN